jgi:hypothetical protein
MRPSPRLNRIKGRSARMSNGSLFSTTRVTSPRVRFKAASCSVRRRQSETRFSYLVIAGLGQVAFPDVSSRMHYGEYENAVISGFIAVNHAVRIHQDLAIMGVRKLGNCVPRLRKVDQTIDRLHDSVRRDCRVTRRTSAMNSKTRRTSASWLRPDHFRHDST